jgi:hypothetical protein
VELELELEEEWRCGATMSLRRSGGRAACLEVLHGSGGRSSTARLQLSLSLSSSLTSSNGGTPAPFSAPRPGSPPLLPVAQVHLRAAMKLPVGRVGLEPPYRRRHHEAPPEPPSLQVQEEEEKGVRRRKKVSAAP